jgi:hypothetical protein
MWALPLLVTIVATAEVKGTPEPCGCTSDPLGDVARVATLSRDGLWVDAGSLSYDHEQASPERRGQADATAAALGRILTRAKAEVGLGADDLVRGAAHVTPGRQACNVRGVTTVAPHVRIVGGVKIGVFGVTQPARLEDAKLTVEPPAPAAKRAVAQLRKQGAQVVVALCGMSRPETRMLMRAVPGIDLAVVGADVGDGTLEPEQVGDGFLVMPADQARYAATMQLDVHGPGKLSWYGGESAQKRQIDKEAGRIAVLKMQLEQWKKDPTADKAFVAARQTELDQLVREQAALQTTKPTPPTGNWFSYALVPVNRKIARDPDIAKELARLAHDIGQANLLAAKDQPAPPAEPGEPTYVGSKACATCHKPAVDFWTHTVHAQAWKTLVDVDKQYNFDCIRCHVTGWEQPGGSNLGTVEKRGLVDVQCEVCHGPGSIHVQEAGMEEKKTLVRKPPDDFCVSRCHTKEHSDTFALVPYLRDILGKGHGEKARAQLGQGVTGHELRTRALEAAGRK